MSNKINVKITHFFVKKRDRLIDDTAHDTLLEETTIVESPNSMAASDVQRFLALMPNRRYASVIQKLIIEEYTPEELAAEMHITTDNLYNIKRRAMMQLMQVALNDIRNYGKK